MSTLETSRFLSNPSPKAQASIAALQDLADAEGLDAVERVFATVASPVRYAQFSREGMSHSHSRHVCVHRLLGKKRCPEDRAKMCEPHRCLPGTDHMSEWRDEGKCTVAIVSQPYGLSWDTLRKIVRFGETYGLAADVDAERSWWFPGSTVLLRWFRRDSAPLNVHHPIKEDSQVSF